MTARHDENDDTPERAPDRDDRNEGDSVEIDGPSTDSPRSEREVEELQRSQIGESPALDDPDIAEGDVDVLPGTGGPDDPGDVDVDPDDVNIPPHPRTHGH